VPKIVLNTFGSFGDLHPYLAIAIELKRRGHHPVLATSEIYRKKVEAEGVSFAAVRPDIGELMDQAGFLKLLWDRKYGTKYLIRDYLIPASPNPTKTSHQFVKMRPSANPLCRLRRPVGGRSPKAPLARDCFAAHDFFLPLRPARTRPRPWAAIFLDSSRPL